jgi:pimeloyl-ACP methyl ester carboxylesterase
MPSHIYIRTGDYDEAARVNAAAIVADKEFIARTGTQGFYTMMYYNHNIHFLASANAMQGRYTDALKSARELEASVTPHLKAMPMLEMFAPYETVTLVRFRKWDEVLKAPKPAAELRITTAYWHFARGLAFAGTNRVADADGEVKALQAIIKAVDPSATIGNSTAQQVLKVAEETLVGQVALARGDKKTGFEWLNKAVASEDLVGYNEPPDWDLPVREFLGGALLANGENQEAERVFRAELAKHLRNGRALFGLVESLKRQGKTNSAAMVHREFEQAWADAEIKLTVEDLSGMSAKPISVNHHPSTSKLVLKTGVRLNYISQGDPAGPVVIMLHGYSDSLASFNRILPLMDRKYRVYVLDQRGHGDSERPDTGYTLPVLAQDVLAFMDAKGIKEAAIVGHSMGSFVAQHVAANAPERVTRLMLAGTATTVRNNTVRELQQQIDALKDPVSEEFVHAFQASTVYRSLPREFMDQVVRESMKLPARVWRDMMAGMLASGANAQLRNIKSPTLIIWGDRESIFPRVEQDALLAAIPHAVLKVYTETGHGPHWEQPDRFGNDLRAFLDEL